MELSENILQNLGNDLISDIGGQCSLRLLPGFLVQSEIRGERERNVRRGPSRDCANRHAAAHARSSAGRATLSSSILVGDIFCGHPYLAASEKCHHVTSREGRNLVLLNSDL